MQVLFGFVLAVFVSTLAWWAHALSRSGAVAATLLGTIIFGLGGLSWAILLLGFFISSSLFSRLFSRPKAGLVEKYSKGFSAGCRSGAGKWRNSQSDGHPTRAGVPIQPGPG